MGGPEHRGLRRVIVFSAVVHGVALSAAVALGGWDPGGSRKPQTVLVTKLVRLGKERPENLLPRKVAPAPPPAPVPIAVKAPEPEPAEAKPAAKTPSAQERVTQLAQVSKALDRLRRQSADEEPEGRADGSVDGEVSSLAQALEGNLYGTEIHRCLQSNYAIEGVSSATVKNRSAIVVIRIGADGTFLEHRIVRGSGVAAFDRAVERALRLCGKVSPPPASLRDDARDPGIEVEFQP